MGFPKLMFEQFLNIVKHKLHRLKTSFGYFVHIGLLLNLSKCHIDILKTLLYKFIECSLNLELAMNLII